MTEVPDGANFRVQVASGNPRLGTRCQSDRYVPALRHLLAEAVRAAKLPATVANRCPEVVLAAPPDPKQSLYMRKAMYASAERMGMAIYTQQRGAEIVAGFKRFLW